MSLCRSSIEKLEDNIENPTTKCNHKVNNSLYFESCWMITELDKAVSLGYEILDWFEIHYFEEKSFCYLITYQF